MKNDRLDEWEEILGILNTTADQRRQIMEMRKDLQLKRVTFKQLITQLIDIKKQIFSEGAKFDIIMDNLRKILNPKQIGQFLVWLETKKDKDNLNSFDLWNIKRIKKNKIQAQDEDNNEPMTEELIDSGSKTVKAHVKRTNKRKNKNLKNNAIDLEDDEILFNDGDGLIDSDQDEHESSP